MPQRRANSNKQLVGILVLTMMCISGCLGGSNTNNNSYNSEIVVPEWDLGDWWMYTFTTPEFGDVTTRFVVTEIDAEENTSYMLGITNQLEAHRHALLNFNPFLGRITHNNLSVYETGIPQSVLSFPLVNGKQWSFDLFGFTNWNAEIILIENSVAYIAASHEEGGIITYSFDNNIEFLSGFLWKDNDETVKMEMTWSGQKGEDYTGEAYFVRAYDLRNELYEGNDGEAYDSMFLNNGHPSDGDFDHLYIYLDVEITSTATSHGSFTIKDHQGISPKTETWNAGTSEKGSISVIPSQSGEYSLTVTCTGTDSIIHVIIVGGLETTWEL